MASSEDETLGELKKRTTGEEMEDVLINNVEEEEKDAIIQQVTQLVLKSSKPGPKPENQKQNSDENAELQITEIKVPPNEETENSNEKTLIQTEKGKTQTERVIKRDNSSIDSLDISNDEMSSTKVSRAWKSSFFFLD